MTAIAERFRSFDRPLWTGGPMHFSTAGICAEGWVPFYGRCRRKDWIIAPIPNTIAGNRIATTIGGRAAAFGIMSRGAIIKKAAARPVIAAHCLAILEKL